MNILRQHPTLEDLIKKEVPGVPNPRQSASQILQRTAGAESLVLYRDRLDHWVVLPVGAGHELRTLGQASRARVNGKTPVAYCRLEPPRQP